jgi:acetylornithine deacetylase/succinyl-diaminopimelate desuccinylase-like protein
MNSPDLLDISRSLIRLDTTNPGSTEERAAQYVADALQHARVEYEHVEPAPGRVSIVSRTRGSNQDLPPLVLHAHLDTVPVQEDGWLHDPFGAEIVDGELWGRGAVDMKVAAAMLLQLQLDCDGGQPPKRDLIVAYFADEEMGGPLGSQWIVAHRPELFAGAQEALGEIGGFNVDLPTGDRVFFVQAAERGMLWVRVVVRGGGGHAAFATSVNPLAVAAELISALCDLRLNEGLLQTSIELERGLASLLGVEPTEDALTSLSGMLGASASLVTQGRRTQFVPTVVSAGKKLNVVPSSAEVSIDCRFLPGNRDEALAAIRAIAPQGAEVDVIAEAEGLQSPTSGPVMTAMRAAIADLHPGAMVLPFVMPGGSDGQKLARIGITAYGYTPLVLPKGFSYLDMFHAVNERLPVDAIAPGYDLLKSLVLRY